MKLIVSIKRVLIKRKKKEEKTKESLGNATFSLNLKK